MAMDTDSNADEEGADESRDGQDGHFSAAATPVHCPSERAVSAPCSPSGSRPGPGSGSALDLVSFQNKADVVRPSSLPPSSPRAVAHNDWVYDAAICSAERQHPGMVHKDKAATKPVMQPVMSGPGVYKSIVKKEDGLRAHEVVLTSDQLVPDYAARPHQDEHRNVSNGRPQTLLLPTENGTSFIKKIDASCLPSAEECHINGGSVEDVSVKKEKVSQNLLQWTVADVASYFSDAGFPEQALAFRSQEIDGKSLLLMQRSDVLTGLSIRLGPALKIYERHIKVLQRTHFLEFDDL